MAEPMPPEPPTTRTAPSGNSNMAGWYQPDALAVESVDGRSRHSIARSGREAQSGAAELMGAARRRQRLGRSQAGEGPGMKALFAEDAAKCRTHVGRRALIAGDGG